MPCTAGGGPQQPLDAHAVPEEPSGMLSPPTGPVAAFNQYQVPNQQEEEMAERTFSVEGPQPTSMELDDPTTTTAAAGGAQGSRQSIGPAAATEHTGHQSTLAPGDLRQDTEQNGRGLGGGALEEAVPGVAAGAHTIAGAGERSALLRSSSQGTLIGHSTGAPLGIEKVYALARTMRVQPQLGHDDEEKLQMWYRWVWKMHLTESKDTTSRFSAT